MVMALSMRLCMMMLLSFSCYQQKKRCTEVQRLVIIILQ